MAGEGLPARLSLHSQLWFRWTGKCSETTTSHMQTDIIYKTKQKMNALEELLVNKIRRKRDDYLMDPTDENSIQLNTLNDLWSDYIEVKTKSIKIKISQE